MLNQLTQQPIADSDLKSLASLCKKQLELELLVETRTADLETLASTLRTLSTQTIPDKMKDLGLSELKLDSGEKVTVNPFYSAAIVKENHEEAIDWLDNNDLGSVIKREISVPFERGEKKQVARVLTALKKLGIAFERSETVHPQTLKALFRELSEGGKTLPSKLFKTFVGNTTKITK